MIVIMIMVVIVVVVVMVERSLLDGVDSKPAGTAAATENNLLNGSSRSWVSGWPSTICTLEY